MSAEDPQLSASLAAAAGLAHELPEPLHGAEPDPHQLPHEPPQDHVPVAADTAVGHGQEVGVDGGLPFHHGGDATCPPAPAPSVEAVVEVPVLPATTTVKKRVKKLPLTPHEALLFAPRGIYVDVAETGQLRCSCNHKPCDKWDQFGYTRHFGFKVHRRYEEERLDDAEIQRLREAKEAYMRLHPHVEEPSIRKKRRMREGEKMLSVDELRVQERHWMAMWKDAKNELRQMRQDLKTEVDEEVRAELLADIEGLKRRKGDWARLLGLNEAHNFAVNL